jgi:uncharacterized phage protein (TIGR01671 family)
VEKKLMSREIKFRAWSPKEKKYFLPNCCVHAWNDDYGYASLDQGLIGEDFKDEKPETEVILQQFTGLQDSTGKDIYEGDIVNSWTPTIEDRTVSASSSTERTFIVEFKNGGFNVGNKTECWSCHKEYKVIGNIFENPELI